LVFQTIVINILVVICGLKFFEAFLSSTPITRDNFSAISRSKNDFVKTVPLLSISNQSLKIKLKNLNQ